MVYSQGLVDNGLEIRKVLGRSDGDLLFRGESRSDFIFQSRTGFRISKQMICRR